MKLKDFVFNSLRVRGKKKKKTSSGAAATPDISTGCFGLDKNRNWFPSSHSRSRSQNSSFDDEDLIEANWKGNALYKGLALEKDLQENRKLIAVDYTSSKAFSQSEAGSSSSLAGFDMTLDNSCSLETVSEHFDSCSSTSPLPEVDADSSLIHQQYYSYHRHRQHHHHYHQENGHIDNHFKKLTSVLQQHNQCLQHLSFPKTPVTHKSESGFFRKSLASLKNIRKHGGKSKSTKHSGHAQKDCSQCFISEDKVASLASAISMPTKMKKQGLQLSSKSTENKNTYFSTDNFENHWALGSIDKNDPSPIKDTLGSFVSTCVPYDRSYVRETSVDSCPPCHYGFQEEFRMGDFDAPVFESASFSGYESDISRGRSRRSRSRIKTNPWLPSPQLTNSTAKGWHGCELRESKENIPLFGEDWTFPHSDLLEYHDGSLLCFQEYPENDYSGRYRRKYSTRNSLNDIKVTLSLNSHTGSPYCVAKRSLDQQFDRFASYKSLNQRTPSLNDLSVKTSTLREAPTFSPNSEFSMLAENFEQLANSVSFEYEDTFDTTMESVSTEKELNPVSCREICADEEDGKVTKQILKSKNCAMTRSPDSGVSSMGCPTGGSNLILATQRQTEEVSVECLLSLTHVDNFSLGERQEPRMYSTRDTSETQVCSTFNIPNTSPFSSPRKLNVQILTSKRKSQRGNCTLGGKHLTAAHESLYSKRACHQDCTTSTATDVSEDRTLPLEKTHTYIDSRHEHSTLDEIDCFVEKMDACNGQVLVPGHSIGAEDVVHRYLVDVPLECLKSSKPVAFPEKTVTSRFSGASRLKLKLPMLNNIEKISDPRQIERSWMEEFDCPRNITASENVESPTENWQWDYQFAMFTSLEADASTDKGRRAVFDDVEHSKESKQGYDLGNIEVEELVVAFEDTDRKIGKQEEAQVTAKVKGSLDKISVETLENGMLDRNFEMSDVSVQTDFDGDENGADDDGDESRNEITNGEDRLYDLSESCQLWLPTGYVFLNSHIGCSSQTKESAITYDEPTATCLEGINQHEPEDNMYCEESRTQYKLSCLQSKSYLYPDTSSRDNVINGAQSKGYLHEHQKHDMTVRGKDMKQLSLDTRCLAMGSLSKSRSRQELEAPLYTEAPDNTVNIALADIDMHCRNVLRQLPDYVSREADKLPKPSHYNSQGKVQFSCSSSSLSEADTIKENKYGRNMAIEFEDKESSRMNTETIQWPDNLTLPQSNRLENYAKSSWHGCQDGNSTGSSLVDTNGNFVYNRSRLSGSAPSFFADEQDNLDNFVITPLNTHKAGYLTLKADSPVQGALVERPLCSVSSASTFREFRLEQTQGSRGNPPCASADHTTYTSPIPSSVLTSSSEPNWARKLKYKQHKQHQLIGDDVVTDSDAECPSRSSISNQNCSLQMLNGQPEITGRNRDNTGSSRDNTGHNPNNNGSNQETSVQYLPLRDKGNSILPEFVSNSVYSFAKAPPRFHHRYRLQTSSHETSSHITAVSLQSTSKYRQPIVTPTEAPTTVNSDCLAEKVISLCQEKEAIFQKIHEAKQEETRRKEQRLQIQTSIRAQTREALLQPLIELRNKLEEQSRLLNEKCSLSGPFKSPLRFL